MEKETYVKQYLDKVYNSNWFSQLNEWTQKSLKQDFEMVAKIRYSDGYYNELESVKKKLNKRNRLIHKLRQSQNKKKN